MSLKIHEDIVSKLDDFIKLGKIPNIIFYGPNGSGKHTIVSSFVAKLYGDDKNAVKTYVLHANCAHGKGIKFVREDLKLFAKTHINIDNVNNFKTIILSNADSLTIDAQSALRRCIEQFSHTTRFFVIVNDKSRLLKPILSRFCELYIPLPTVNSRKINLYKYNSDKCFCKDNDTNIAVDWIKKHITSIDGKSSKELLIFADKMYQRGFSGRDLLAYIEQCETINPRKKTSMLLSFHKVKKDFRNERIFIFFMLIRSNNVLENVYFI